MGATAWQFAGSLAAVAVMIGLAWRFGFAGAPELDGEREARALADGLPGGFDAVEVALDGQGHAALLRDARGRIAVVHPHGAHFVASLLNQTTSTCRKDEILVLTFAGRTIRLDLGAAKATDWAAAIDRLG